MLKKKYFKTKDEAEITFEFARNDVKQVELLAEFNDWKPISMTFNKSSKAFRTKVRLPKESSFAFRYLLDGVEWENDYQADQYLPNVFGSEDSIVNTYC